MMEHDPNLSSCTSPLPNKEPEDCGTTTQDTQETKKEVGGVSSPGTPTVSSTTPMTKQSLPSQVFKFFESTWKKILADDATEEPKKESSAETPVLSLHKLSNSKEVVMFFENIWRVELKLDGDIGPRHRALEILRDQGITGEILFSAPSLGDLKSKLKTDYGFPLAPAESVALQIFEMKEKISEQQKSEVKTGALKKIRDAVRDFHHTGERKAFKLKAQWAFKHSYGLEEAVKLAMVSINRNIEVFGRKEGRIGDDERFLHELATLVSSGGGKTHFLDALRAHLVRWAENDPLASANSSDSSLVDDADSKALYLPIEISFNSDTPYVPELEKVINPFISRIAFEMLYLRTNHQEHFHSSAAPRLTEIEKEFADVTIGELFDSLARAARECRRHVVFLVDEVGVLVQREGFSQLLKDFKRNARTHGFTMIWTTFDSKLYEDDGKPFIRPNRTPSGSPLIWIPLYRFSSSTMGMIAEDEKLKEAAKCPPYRFVMSLLSGHQRSIEIFSSYLNEPGRTIRPTVSVEGLIDQVEKAMFKYWSPCGPQAYGTCYEAEEFVRILKAFAFNEMLDFSERFWQLLIERSVLLNSLEGSGRDFPQFHALWLRVLISRAQLSPRPGELPLQVDQLPMNYPRGECLKLLHQLALGFFDVLPTVHSSWESLEHVHIYFECLRHTLLAWKQEHSTVENYYGALPQVRKPVSSVFLTKPERKATKRVRSSHCVPSLKHLRLLDPVATETGLEETVHEAPRKRNKKGAASRVTYLDMGRDFRFAPHHTPLSGIPQKLDSKRKNLWNFFAARKGACLAPDNQKGFDSALWSMKIDEHGNKEHPILFLYETKFSSTDSADPKLKTSELSQKVSHVRDVIAEYNAANVGATLRESDVILVFVALRRIPLAREAISMSDFGGTVLALQKDFLVEHFYRSMMPFFEISSALLAKYPRPKRTPRSPQRAHDHNTVFSI